MAYSEMLTDSNHKEPDYKDVVGTYKRGKEVYITSDRSTGMWQAKFTKGGEIPKKIGGRWTNYEMARRDISGFLKATEEAKKVKK